jgi:predicted N-acetyltransferase YhbS
MTPKIRLFEPEDSEGVISLVLPIQQIEFGVPITREEQPDLTDISGFFQIRQGGFWVADLDGRIVGCIGLKDIGDGQGVLKKMFVAAGLRGPEFRIGFKLLDTVLTHARRCGFADIYLGTTSVLLATHRFYEKNQFTRISPDQLPANFPHVEVDDRFYHLALSG